MLIRNSISDKVRILIKSGLLTFILIKGVDTIDKWHPPSSKFYEPVNLFLNGEKSRFVIDNPDDFLNYDMENEILIKNVPEYTYNYILKLNLPENISYNSCGPTAALDVFEYWSQNGYPNLTSDDIGTVFTDISKTLGQNGRGTNTHNMPKALLEYAQSKGYDFESRYYKLSYYNKNILWKTIYNEMKAQRPVIAGIPTGESGEINHGVVITGIDEYYKTNSKFTYTSDRYLRINESCDSDSSSYIDFNELDDFCIITLIPQK